jgi:hypothetical protein
MKKDVLLDLANETARRYGGLPPGFADKMAGRIKRKFSIKVEPQKISELAQRFKEIYKFAGTILGEYLRPPKGKYSAPGDVDVDKFLDKLAGEFPADDRDVLRTIGGWVIYYEYLR